MKTSILFLVCLTFTLSATIALADTVANPIKDFAKYYSLSSGRTIYKWNVDLNNDGTLEILLASKLTSEEQTDASKEDNWNPQTPDELGFFVYIPNSNGSGYTQIKGTDFGTYFQPGTVLSVNRTRCFVGKITQLNRWGVVSVDIEPAGKKSTASATVYAYTLEGDHLKVTNLAQYDPTAKGSNAIYDQYLSDAHRTAIKLQEITLP